MYRQKWAQQKRPDLVQEYQRWKRLPGDREHGQEPRTYDDTGSQRRQSRQQEASSPGACMHRPPGEPWNESDPRRTIYDTLSVSRKPHGNTSGYLVPMDWNWSMGLLMLRHSVTVKNNCSMYTGGASAWSMQKIGGDKTTRSRYGTDAHSRLIDAALEMYLCSIAFPCLAWSADGYSRAPVPGHDVSVHRETANCSSLDTFRKQI
jgi:hypothetical protein